MLRDCLFVLLILSPALLPAQQRAYDGNQIADCLQRVKQHNLGQGIVDEMSYIEPLARAHILQATPDMEALFAHSKDPEERAELASALVRLDSKDDQYWNLLVDYAKPALETDFPSPANLDAIADPGMHPDPAFALKAKEHGMTVEAATQYVLFELPSRLSFLAKTGDPRAIPLLRRALSSPLFVVREIAANGLSECQDKDSIPLLIQMCRKAPGFESQALAYSLMFFNDPRAEAAAQKFYLTGGEDIHEVKAYLGPHAFVW